MAREHCVYHKHMPWIYWAIPVCVVSMNNFRYIFLIFSSVTLESGTEVRNIEGSAMCSPVGYDSWKEFYMDNRAWPASCRILGCGDEATDGAHVTINGESGVWIIPMCGDHNHPENTDWMKVNANTGAVCVRKKNTSGPPGICY